MLVTFWENYKVEVYEANDDSGLTNIDLYRSINQIGWNYRLTLQIPKVKDLDYLIKKLVIIDKGE